MRGQTEGAMNMRLVLLALLWNLGLSPLALEAGQITVRPSASYAHENDGGHGGHPLAALADGREPSSSADRTIPRFTFWSRKGTTEWVQLDLEEAIPVSSVDVYWFDDRPGGGCRVPKSWRVLHEAGYTWLPVRASSTYKTTRDRYHRVVFEPVTTQSIRIEVSQQPGMSSGILECKINGQSLRLGKLGIVGETGNLAMPFDYPRTRLSLACLAKAVDADEQQEIAKALIRLDSLAESLLSSTQRFRQGDQIAIDEWKQASAEVALIEKQFAVDEIPSRLDSISADRRLELMIQLDWLDQDRQDSYAASFMPFAAAASDESSDADLLADELLRVDAPTSPVDPRWMDVYLRVCRQRRQQRMGAHVHKFPRIVFTRHHDIGGQHYAYTEDVSDSPYNDNNPFPHSGQLCLLEMDGLFGREQILLDEPDGLIRDPDVSFDGQRVLFARRTSMTEDDYHLYEMDMADQSVRQLTSGQGAADTEPAYLPGGDIIFNSSRCQQIVDCWWADVSNLYTCDADGRFLRRLSFDQVHTNYPQVLSDGRVVYTRWDYNDRGQLFPQPLFEMNPDGTGQRGYYGNSSWFPTTILHARGIPGTQKLVCILSGHHTYQKGKLAIIDPAKGREENLGTQLIAPIRPTEAVKVDKYGYQGEQFQYPYALSETEFLVTYSTEGSLQGRAASEKPFGIYFMTVDGRRELLTATPRISSSQAVPLVPRPEPRLRASHVDYRKATGTYVLQDVYSGPGLHGIPRGTVKQLRVVALEFRAAGVGKGRNNGPAGGALVSTPISINGAWDVKRVLGTTPVYEDGSAAFEVPARTPLYFQALDKKGHVVQSMRSWSTLQPGETFSCVGCHDHKNTSPPTGATSLAMRAGPGPLEPFGDPNQGYSFAQRVQPILDKHCVQCHSRKTLAEGRISLEAIADLDEDAQKAWSDAYKALADPKHTNWVSPQSVPSQLPPYSTGAAKSRLIEMLEAGHEDVTLSPTDLAELACWIDLAVPFAGDYTEAMPDEQAAQYTFYLDKRRQWAAEDQQNIESLLKAEKE